LMIEHSVGARLNRAVEFKKLDEDYFDEEDQKPPYRHCHRVHAPWRRRQRRRRGHAGTRRQSHRSARRSDYFLDCVELRKGPSPRMSRRKNLRLCNTVLPKPWQYLLTKREPQRARFAICKVRTSLFQLATCQRTLTPKQLFLCNLFYSHYSVVAFGGK